jgi:hypothetical protein
MSNDKQYIRDMCDVLKSKLPDNHGFILLTFPFGGEPGRLTYAATGERKDCINAMKEFLIRNDSAEDWMKHIK